MKSLYSLEWGYLEIDKISHLEGKGPSSRIRITLLFRLCGLQAVVDQLHLFFGFLDNIGAKHLTVSSLRPVERGVAFTTI
jgi:hypothetical protein